MTVELQTAAIAALRPIVLAEMPNGRRACRIPDRVVRELVELGLFRLWIPRRYGGFELPLPVALRIYEAVARLDGSVGWAVMIGSGGGLFAAYLAPPVARNLFAAPAAVVAGSGAPTGTAERVPGGYRATGRWRYASGAHYATVFTANCRITDQDKPVLPGNQVLIRAMSFAPEDVIIHRTWDTTGLRATGSHDIEVIDAFVPEAATFSVFTDQPLETGPLYRLPFGTLTELPVSAVALGIAEHALEEFEALTRLKPFAGSGVPLHKVESVQRSLRNVRTRLDEARSTLYEHANIAWETAVSAGGPTRQVVTACTEASICLVRLLVSAIGELVPLAGMNALHTDDPFSVAWNDLNATAAHYSVSPLNLSE